MMPAPGVLRSLFILARSRSFASDLTYTGPNHPATIFALPRENPRPGPEAERMKKIGVLFGMEISFPGALVERINSKHIDDLRAEFVVTGAVPLDKAPPYSVLVDRISHEIPFYRAFLKHAALHGCVVLNNPFWGSADDKFLNYTLAAKLGVAVPPTVILPHKQHPGATTGRSMRNLEFPLDWEFVFASVGEHGFLKPVDGGGWRDVHEVRNREEFFRAYDGSRDLCMMYQKAVDFTDYFRCYVVGQKKVRIMAYDPLRPHSERYLQHAGTHPPAAKKLLRRIQQDALLLCRALGYDMNTVEFAVQGGIPYAIDFMNPVPDADLHTIGPANFEWFVEQVAELAIARARTAPKVPELRWPAFLGPAFMGAAPKRATARKGDAVNKSKPVEKSAPQAAHDATRTPKRRDASPQSSPSLEAEEESAAAQAEPMGSIAAAVPGNDALAQDALNTREQPGAEAPEIRDQPETTAGTEEHLQDKAETA